MVAASINASNKYLYSCFKYINSCNGHKRRARLWQSRCRACMYNMADGNSAAFPLSQSQCVLVKNSLTKWGYSSMIPIFQDKSIQFSWPLNWFVFMYVNIMSW